MRKIHWRNQLIPAMSLGTVQLGLNYGIANSDGKPCQETANAIVRAAIESGVEMFDTAQAYGDSESALGTALKVNKVENPLITSKLSPELDPNDGVGVVESVKRSLSRLGIGSLWCLMSHRQNWLDGWGDGLGHTLRGIRGKGLAEHIGVSVYSPEAALKAVDNPDIDVIQMPFNAWDWRMETEGILSRAAANDKLCVLRGVYLQGLLLLPPAIVAKRVPAALEHAEKWCQLLDAHSIDAKSAALSAACSTGWPILVGAETPGQFRESAALFENAAVVPGVVLHQFRGTFAAMTREEVVNPALWPEL